MCVCVCVCVRSYKYVCVYVCKCTYQDEFVVATEEGGDTLNHTRGVDFLNKMVCVCVCVCL